MQDLEPWGETIAADTQRLTVECHALYRAPEFGSVVRVDGAPGVFGVVYAAATAPFDGTRIVQAHRLPPGELEERKPHLTTLLRTTFSARVIGAGAGTDCRVGAPSQAARLHAFVYPAQPAEVRALTETPHFLRPLSQTPEAPVEDLLVAALRTAREAWGAEGGPRLVTWGKYLSRLLARDYLTLEGIFQRLGDFAPGTSPDAEPPPTGRADLARRAGEWEKPLRVVTARPPGSDPFAD
jgi:hypothetical protein